MPELQQLNPVGNDGLTHSQRDQYAAAYHRTAAAPLSAHELQAMTAWRQKRQPFDEEGAWMLTTADRVGEDV